MKEESRFSRLFRSVLNVFKSKKSPEGKVERSPVHRKRHKPKKIHKSDPKEEPRKKAPKRPSNPEGPKYNTVQMPAPWSKVEKYKRIKKEGYYDNY